MVASRTASHRKKLNIQADSQKLVKPNSALPAANCESPTNNQTYAEFKYITRVQRLHSDVIDSSNKVASVRTCRPRH